MDRIPFFLLTLLLSAHAIDGIWQKVDRKADTLTDAELFPSGKLLKSRETKPIGAQSNGYTITKRAAVFFRPTTERVQQMKKGMTDEGFNSLSDDASFYSANVNGYLRKRDIIIYDADQNLKFINFVRTNKKIIRVDLRKTVSPYGLYLFDPRKNPREIGIFESIEKTKKYFED